MAKKNVGSKKAKTMETTKTKAKNEDVDVIDVEVKEELTESLISNEERLEMISEAAYYRAEARGFSPGDQLRDWLEAESLVDEMLNEAVKEARY